MNLYKALWLFAFFVFTCVVFGTIRFLVNQPSDILLVLAGVLFLCYLWIAIQSKAFTKNPFKP